MLGANPNLHKLYWYVVQLVERLTVNQEVASSSLAVPAIKYIITQVLNRNIIRLGITQ